MSYSGPTWVPTEEYVAYQQRRFERMADETPLPSDPLRIENESARFDELTRDTPLPSEVLRVQDESARFEEMIAGTSLPSQSLAVPEEGSYPGSTPVPTADPNAGARITDADDPVNKTLAFLGVAKSADASPNEKLTHSAGVPVSQQNERPLNDYPTPDPPSPMQNALPRVGPFGVTLPPPLPIEPAKPVPPSQDEQQRVLEGRGPLDAQPDPLMGKLGVRDVDPVLTAAVGGLARSVGKQQELSIGGGEGTPGTAFRHLDASDAAMGRRAFTNAAIETSGIGGDSLVSAARGAGDVSGAGGAIGAPRRSHDLPPEVMGDVFDEAPRPGKILEAAQEQIAKGQAAGKGSGWARSYWYFALLSNPLTHARNILGNVGMGIAEGVTRPLAVAVDQALSLIPDRDKALSWNELPAEAVGAAIGLRVGAKNAVRAFRDPSVASAMANKHELRDALPPGSDSSSALVRGAGRAVSFPSQMLGVADAFFRGINSQAVVWGEAARAVSQRPEHAGKPITDHGVWDAITELVENPTSRIARDVERRTAEMVFQDEPDAMVRAVNSLRGKAGPLGWLALPFTTTPGNVFKAGIRHAVGTDWTRLDKLHTDPVEQAETLGRLGAAVGVAYAAWNLAGEGLLTGTAPQYPDRDLWLKTHQENSIKVGGAWVKVRDVLGPYAPLVTGIADAHQATKYERKPADIAGAMAGGFFAAMLDLPWLPPVLSDALDDIRAGRSVSAKSMLEDAERALIRPVEALAAPGIVRFAQRVQEQLGGEPYARETRSDVLGGAVDRVKAAIPGQAETLPRKYDVLGEPTERQPLESLLPLSVSRKADDPVVSELERLRTARGEGGATIGHALTRMSRTIRRGGESITLEPERYAELQRTAGEMIRVDLETLIRSREYQVADDGAKAKRIAAAVGKARDRATEKMLGPKQTPTRTPSSYVLPGGEPSGRYVLPTATPNPTRSEAARKGADTRRQHATATAQARR